MHPSASTTHAGRYVIHLSPRDIPPLPDAMLELLGIANDPDVSFGKLGEVMCRDQALTLRVLAVANSPYYGCSRRIDSVRSAIAVLGTKQVQNIASAMALAPAFKSRRGPYLWKHGLSTAVWTTHVVRALGVPPLDYVFTAGLLHDIGVVLLWAAPPSRRRRVSLRRSKTVSHYARWSASILVPTMPTSAPVRAQAGSCLRGSPNSCASTTTTEHMGRSTCASSRPPMLWLSCARRRRTHHPNARTGARR